MVLRRPLLTLYVSCSPIVYNFSDSPDFHSIALPLVMIDTKSLAVGVSLAVAQVTGTDPLVSWHFSSHTNLVRLSFSSLF